MKFISSKISGLFFIKPNLFIDNRGSFRRNYCYQEFKKSGIDFKVKQSNISINKKKFTLRGFHYQKLPSKESKILTVISGEIFNVVIDLRKNSKTYLKHYSFRLSSNSCKSFLVPAGCANAFLTLKSNTIINYLMSDYFAENTYSGFKYNDKYFKIKWPHKPLVISDRDKNYDDFTV